MVVRASTSKGTSLLGARNQPIRSPPHSSLLALPTVIVSVPLCSPCWRPFSRVWAANGLGIGSAEPSSASSAAVSSTTAVVPARPSARATRSRAASSINAPVGLWKSGISSASRGEARRKAVSSAAMSQPSVPTGWPTIRACAPCSVWIALG
jgi:hypothetical protein